jgi:hypothetical protein
MTTMRLRWDREFDLLAGDAGSAHVPNRNAYALSPYPEAGW